jgi:hypothetical protein
MLRTALVGRRRPETPSDHDLRRTIQEAGRHEFQMLALSTRLANSYRLFKVFIQEKILFSTSAASFA